MNVSGARLLSVSTPPVERDVRAVPGHRGHVWLATAEGLLTSADAGKSFRPVPGPESARRVRFGKAPAGRNYPAVYLVGTVDGKYGFFRSDDRGATWTSINDDRHVFGEITSISGDPRVAGRVYLSSRNRGILYGDRAKAAQPTP